MCFIAAAAGKSIYKSIPLLDWNYGTLALISWAFVLLAGIAYVGGLIAMALAGARSMGNRSSKPTSLGVQLINGSARARSGRSPDWLKCKNPEAPAVKREAEEEWER